MCDKELARRDHRGGGRARTCLSHKPGRYWKQRAFSLVELMVVIAIIAIVLGAIIHVSQLVIARGRAKESSAILQKLDIASKEFEAKKPLGKMGSFIKRYANYPPDDLDGFTSQVGLPPSPPGTRISPSGAELTINGATASSNVLRDVKYGDIKAFALAVRLFSDTGTAILDQIEPRYRRSADTGSGGQFEFLDRNGNQTFEPEVDEPLDYFADAWGTPIGYFSNCDMRVDPSSSSSLQQYAAAWDQTPNVPAQGDRLRTCLTLVHLNNSVPFFVSYGPDGPDQFSPDFAGSREAKDLVWDYTAPSDSFDYKDQFDNPFNQDNVYSHEGLSEKIAAVKP